MPYSSNALYLLILFLTFNCDHNPLILILESNIIFLILIPILDPNPDHLPNITILLQAQLVADPNDCHTFYHCDELSPQKQSCGDLMFNTIKMVS